MNEMADKPNVDIIKNIACIIYKHVNISESLKQLSINALTDMLVSLYKTDIENNILYKEKSTKFIDVVTVQLFDNIHINDDLINYDQFIKSSPTASIDEKLVVACKSGNLKMVKAFHENGANLSYNNDKPLNSAILSNNLNIVKYLHKHGVNLYSAYIDGCILDAVDDDKYLDIIVYFRNHVKNTTWYTYALNESKDNALKIYEFLKNNTY